MLSSLLEDKTGKVGESTGGGGVAVLSRVVRKGLAEEAFWYTPEVEE